MENLKNIKEAIFVIDMNNGFCEKGNLADPSIKHIVPNIRENIRKTLKNKGALFFVNDKHASKSVELTRYASHCATEEEQKTIKELAIFEPYATKIFYKNNGIYTKRKNNKKINAYINIIKETAPAVLLDWGSKVLGARPKNDALYRNVIFFLRKLVVISYLIDADILFLIKYIDDVGERPSHDVP